MSTALYEPKSLGWTFPIIIRGVERSHGYTADCPQLADDADKAVGTVSIVKADGTPAVDENSAELTDMPMTALTNDGTSLEFTLYDKIIEEGSYQMQGMILIPDPDNPDNILEIPVNEKFRIKSRMY